MRIDVAVPDGKQGAWSVETFTVSESEAKLERARAMFSFSSRGRGVPEGNYKALKRNGSTIMSNTPDEISDQLEFIRKAKTGGHILINGLGLGVTLTAILKSDTIESVTVIEKSQDVISLVAPSFFNDTRVKIICADALEYKPPRGVHYSAVWHDIWDNICSDNIPEMTKLHKKYRRKTAWQGSWCKHECQRNR